MSDTSMHLAAMLENGALDAAIMNEGTPSATNEQLTLTHVLQEEPLVWVSNPDGLIDWAEEVPFIAFSEGTPVDAGCRESVARSRSGPLLCLYEHIF